MLENEEFVGNTSKIVLSISRIKNAIYRKMLLHDIWFFRKIGHFIKLLAIAANSKIEFLKLKCSVLGFLLLVKEGCVVSSS